VPEEKTLPDEGAAVAQAAADDEDLVVELEAEEPEAKGGKVTEPAREKPEEPAAAQKGEEGIRKVLKERDATIRRMKAQLDDREAVLTRLAAIEEGVALSHDRDAEDYEPRRQAWEVRRKQQPTAVQQAVAAFYKAARDEGLDIGSKGFQDFFGKLSGPAEAMEKIASYKAEHEGRSEQAEKARKDEMKALAAEVARPLLDEINSLKQRLGLKTVETGGPSVAPGIDTSNLSKVDTGALLREGLEERERKRQR